jgi:hypothetical protein
LIKAFLDMNRLVIIGNGFDLAHGLPTSYRDFVDDYWKGVCDTKGTKTIKHTDDFVTLKCEFGYSYNTSEFNVIDNLKSFSELKEFILRNRQNKSGEFSIVFNNLFFQKICENSIENWVDIENEYYKLLKECLKKNNNEYIIGLNEQFFAVKNLLNKYLTEKVEANYIFSKELVEKFTEIFETNKYEDFGLDRFYNEISKKQEQVLEFEFQKKQEHLDKVYYGNLCRFPREVFKKNVSVENYFLSFNYTSTVLNYIKMLDMNFDKLNEIHGRLEDERNPINFGFGDEMDKHYQEIEEKNDNEYLRNIKSFQYLHTPNYKRLLDLIDSEKFQVYIMGHSCGLSDRTLLNTIFEHENCCSIKVFYHEIKDENGKVIKDNYTEITQNISRHFNKKKLMREKIVNKTLCQPLPQIKLPLK